MREVKWPYGWGRVGYDWADREPWLHLPFPVSEYEGRIERIRRMMTARGLDGLLVHGNRAERAPIRYLSNFEDYYGGDTLMVIPLAGDGRPDDQLGDARRADALRHPGHLGPGRRAARRTRGRSTTRRPRSTTTWRTS